MRIFFLVANRGLAVVAALFFVSESGAAAPQFSFFSEVLHNDNLSRTDRRWSGQKEGDTALTWRARAEWNRVMENDLRLTTGVEAGGEMWWEVSGLNNVRPMADVALTRRFGLGPTAPYVRAEAAGGHIFYGEAPRDGAVWEGGLAAGRRFNERFAAEAGYRFEEHRARDSFYRSDGHNLFVEGEFAATPRIPLLAGYNFRRGIVHSYTAANQGLTNSPRGMQETFEDLPWAYRTRLNSHTVTVGVAPDLTETVSLTLLYAFQHSHGSGFRYNNHTASAALFFFF